MRATLAMTADRADGVRPLRPSEHKILARKSSALLKSSSSASALLTTTEAQKLKIPPPQLTRSSTPEEELTPPSSFRRRMNALIDSGADEATSPTSVVPSRGEEDINRHDVRKQEVKRNLASEPAFGTQPDHVDVRLQSMKGAVPKLRKLVTRESAVVQSAEIQKAVRKALKEAASEHECALARAVHLAVQKAAREAKEAKESALQVLSTG